MLCVLAHEPGTLIVGMNLWQFMVSLLVIRSFHEEMFFTLFQPGSQVVYEFVDRPAFFTIDRLSGNITLENSILYDSSIQYNVSSPHMYYY